MWLMVTVLDSVVLNFHVFECCWISQIWLYLGPSICIGDFHYVFGGVAEPVRCWRVHRDFLLPLSWGPPCPLSLSPPLPVLECFLESGSDLSLGVAKCWSGLKEMTVGIPQFLRVNDILSGSVGKKMPIISKKKQVCSQKKEEGRQLTFV